jgi:dolichol kinase
MASIVNAVVGTDATPLMRNAVVAAVTVVYVKAVIGLCDLLLSLKLVSPDISRKLVHVAAGSMCIFWPLFSSGDRSVLLNITVPAVYAAQLFYKGAILKDPRDPDVRTMTRTGDPAELLQGPLYFTLVMSAVGAGLFMTSTGAACMAGLGWGDGLAPLAGKYFPVGRYKLSRWHGTKTLSGSSAVFAGTAAGCCLFSSILDMPGLAQPATYVAVGAVAAGVEAVTPDNLDNFSIPIAIYIWLEML